MKFINNQKGFYAVGAALLSAVVIYVLISQTQTKMANTMQLRARNKAILDAQLAIDYFAIELKKAYDLASPAPESNGTTPLDPTASWNLPPQGVAPAETVNFYLPSTAFPTQQNQLCVNRSDARDAAIFLTPTMGVPKVCIKVPDDFSASIDPSGVLLQLKPSLDEQPVSKFATVVQLIHELLPTEAVAQSNISDPGPPSPANSPMVVLSNITIDADSKFKYRYADFDCSNTKSDRFCLNIRICVKYTACNEGEYIKQSYVFLKVPNTSLDK